MLSAPEDYGLDPAMVLAFSLDTAPPAAFDAYWQRIREEVCTLPARFSGSVDAESNDIIIRSSRGVRVVARLFMPSCRPRGVMVTTHGYGADDTFMSPPSAYLERGLAFAQLHLRGYPPSTMDMPDLRGAWILHQIELPDSWILRGAVIDLIQTCRVLRAHFGHEMPLMLHGESFGGGLAVIAAAQMLRLGDPPARLAIGLPSFGCFDWRSDHYCNGAGGQINIILDASVEIANLVRPTLRLFDAAFHARDLNMPMFCKLALLDDTVPAPSAAAIYNAVPAPHKWRFVTKYGHFDGGVADARRHLLFDRLALQFVDPDVDITQFMTESAHLLELEPLRSAGSE